jgi:hypothetical protein
MLRRIIVVAVLALPLAQACETPTAPTMAAAPSRGADLALATQRLDPALEQLVRDVYPGGLAQSVVSRWRNVIRTAPTNFADAEEQLASLVDWVLRKTSSIIPLSGQTQDQTAAWLIRLMRRSLYGEPDLAFQTPFTLLVSEAAAGASITTSAWTVGNMGTAASGAFSAQFYLVAGTVATPLGSPIAHHALAAGALATHDGVTLTIPDGTPLGPYQVVLKLDPGNLLLELDDTNNDATSALTVIDPLPLSGADLILIADINPFDNTSSLSPDNIQFEKNLVHFRTRGVRSAAKRVWFHIGHGFGCVPFASCFSVKPGPTLLEVNIRSAGYEVTEGNDAALPLTNIPLDVKVIFLFWPSVQYTAAEVASLKTFGQQGGRIVYVYEQDFGMQTLTKVQNAFLQSIGSATRAFAGSFACPEPFGGSRRALPKTSLRDYQVTAGLNGLLVGCASAYTVGIGDFPLIYDQGGTHVIAAVSPLGVP